MKCDAAQNRLLAPADPGRLPDAVREHLAGCEACRRFREQAAVLDARLAALPVPSSAARKEAFLETLLAAGPVITVVPAAPPRAGRSLKELLAGRAWKPVGGLAAAALVGVGVWQLRPTPTAVAERPGPRSELVKKVLDVQVELAQLDREPEEAGRRKDKAIQRMDRLTWLAAELEAEARAVSLATGPNAGKTEMRAIARMYDTVVTAGVVGQARKIDRYTRAEDRRKALADATQALTAASAALKAVNASKDAKESLATMATAADAARADLLKLAEGA